MPEGANLALIIRGLVSVLLAVGGILCLTLGARLLFRRSHQTSTSTTFEAKLGGHNVTFSAGTAGTAVVLTSAIWVLGTIVALPSFSESPQRRTVAATTLLTLPFEGSTTTLSAEQRAALDAAAGPLKQATATSQVVVTSNATGGSQEANLAIAERRAEAVQQYLIREHGLPQDKVTVISQGEERPHGIQMPQGVAALKNAVAVITVPRGGT